MRERALFSKIAIHIFLIVLMDGGGVVRRCAKLHRGKGQREYAVCPGVKQCLRAGGSCCAGGDDVIHQQDALALQLLRLCRPESTCHVGYALFQRQTGLMPFGAGALQCLRCQRHSIALASGSAISSGTL